MYRHHTFLLVLALLALGACGRSPDPPSASLPTARPTAAPAATAALVSGRTATAPAASTATPRASGGTESSANAPLRRAIERAGALDVYRLAFTFGAGADASASPQLDYIAAFRGEDAMLRFATPSQAEGQPTVVSIIKAGGVTYARGPLPLQGAEQPVWYTLGAKPPASLQPPFTTAQLLDLLTSRIDLAGFALDDSEALDGQTCDRYRGGLDAALGMADGLGRPTTPEAQAAEATPVVQRMQAQGFTFGDASARLWVCPDGVLHRIRAEVQGTSPRAPGGPFLLRLTFDISEIDGSIAIAPPEEPVTPGTVVPIATVFNGGNMREQPNIRGVVRDQINAGESVRLLAKTADGSWYRIVNARDGIGWVSATLLTIDPSAAAQVPVAEGN